jgi:hypothetical protein
MADRLEVRLRRACRRAE